MIVYHGSSHVIGVPEYNGSKKTNDYGYGFYTTESLEFAKEWACADNRDGFANSYEFEPEHLKILNLNAPEYNTLNDVAADAQSVQFADQRQDSLEIERSQQIGGHKM